ncbi:MAG TPA: hypothetical protein ENK91_17275 [Bacteroidetes bacterium]|nr:hypothetical protein [Bacteroidota bacterium]
MLKQTKVTMQMKDLETLSLSGQIHGFDGLNELALSKINLDYSDLSFCHDLELFFENQQKTLKELSLANCQIDDLGFIRRMKNLTTLNLENVIFDDLSFLYELNKLERLNLFGTNNFGRDMLHVFENLKELAVDNFEFAISRKNKLFPNLEILACRNNEIYPDLYALLKRNNSIQKVFGKMDAYFQWRRDLIEENKVSYHLSYTQALIESERYDKKLLEAVQEFNEVTGLIESIKMSDIGIYSFAPTARS